MNLEGKSIFLSSHLMQKKLPGRNFFGMKRKQLACLQVRVGTVEGSLGFMVSISRINGISETMRENEIMRVGFK